MDKKKLLVIYGSPRKNGNISKMLSFAVNSAKETGWHVDTVFLYDKNISWCMGCMNCKKSGICIINDDISNIREMMKRCDAVVIGAPTYFANVPAVVKNMFDRLVGAVMDDNTSCIPKPKLSKTQKYILITSCSTPFPFDRLFKQSTNTINAMYEFFNISGMKQWGTIIFSGTKNKNKIPYIVN